MSRIKMSQDYFQYILKKALDIRWKKESGPEIIRKILF